MLFIVHRLDREASGLLVFAKSETAKRHLQQQFKEHTAGRTLPGSDHRRRTWLAINTPSSLTSPRIAYTDAIPRRIAAKESERCTHEGS